MEKEIKINKLRDKGFCYFEIAGILELTLEEVKKLSNNQIKTNEKYKTK